MKNKNTDLIAYGSYDIYIGRFLCLAYTVIANTPHPWMNRHHVYYVYQKSAERVFVDTSDHHIHKLVCSNTSF
jgi:hypothetical protein